MSRIILCMVAFASATLLISQVPSPVIAQDKNKDKKDKDKNNNKQNGQDKQLANLRNENAQLERLVISLRNDVLMLKNAVAKYQQENTRLEALLRKEKLSDQKADKTLKDLQTLIDGYREAGVVHVEVFKLKADAPAGELTSWLDEAYSQLAKIKSVRGFWAGKLANGSNRKSEDHTVALVIVFDNLAGLKSYLADPIHTRFDQKHLKNWEVPVVYDFEPKK
jgi:hypothetical protein